jgi:hypothetical protein
MHVSEGGANSNFGNEEAYKRYHGALWPGVLKTI